MQIRNMLIKNYLHQLGYSWLQLASRLPYLLSQPYRNFKLFKNFAAPFPDMTSDATDDRSELICFLGGAEILLMLFRAVKSSIGRTAVVRNSAVAGSRICECPGSG